MRYAKFAPFIVACAALHAGQASAVDSTAVEPGASPPVHINTDLHSPLPAYISVDKNVHVNTNSYHGPLPPTEAVGPLSGVGNYLNDHGVQVGILMDDFFLHQIQTGLRPNTSMNSGDIKYHLSLDLGKILGIPNTSINIDETEYILSHNAFNFVTFSNSYFFPGAGGYQPTMLSRFSLESWFFNHHLDVEVGRMNPIFAFMTPTFCGLCFNGTQARNADFPGPDASVWGGRAAYHLNQNDAVQVGLYENDLYDFQNTNGWNWSTKHATGYIFAANFTHETTFFADVHPLRTEVGIFHNSAKYDDPLLNTDGSSHVLNPVGVQLLHTGGTTGGYAQVRKVVWSEDGALGNPFAKNLAMYGSLFVTPGAGVSYPVEALAGAEFSNFPQPLWMLGLGVHYARIGSRDALYQQQMRVALGGQNTPTPQNMISPTVTLRFPVSKYAIGQAFAEYYINQDASYIPVAQRPKNGWFVGFRVTVDIGKILGLSAGGMPF